MKIEHTEVIDAPLAEVWDLCADPLAFARFGGPGIAVTPAEPGRPPEKDARYRVHFPVGGATVGGDVIVIDVQPQHEFAWSSYTGVSHHVRLRFRQDPRGTRLTVRLSYDAPGLLGGIADLVSYPAMWSLVRTTLDGMKAFAEGTSTAPDGPGLPRQLLNEAGHLAVLARSGIVAPMRPDRLVRVAFAARSWGLSPGALIAVGAARHPDRTAVIDPFGEISYREADHQSTAIGAALRELGVREGDAVALLARNHRGFVLATAAIGKLGCDLLLLNTGFSGPQISDVCRREGASAIIYDAEFADLVADAAATRRRIVIDNENRSGADLTLAQAATQYAETPLPSPGRAGKVIILTSGTTGTPKGASRGARTGGNLPTLEAPAAVLERIPLRSGMRVGLAAPAFHAWGLSNLLLSVALGATIVCLPKFSPQEWLAAIDKYRIEALPVVPVMLSRILDLPEDVRDSYDTSWLRVVAASGSALPGDLSDRWMNIFGDNLYNLYGSTEVANATIATPADLRVAPGTAGRPTRGTTVTLFDDLGIEVPQGEVGRIFVGNSQLFEGYSGGGDKNRLHGLMATGDVGRLDPAGRLFVEGRDDDMIVSGGENVFPKEVEDTLARHHAVAEAACIGVPDERFGQRLRAYVALRDGEEVGADELIALVKANLAGYKAPREIVFVDALPRNATGKVLLRELT